MFQNRSVVYHLIMKGQGFPFNFIRLMMECMFTNFCLSESKVYVSTIVPPKKIDESFWLEQNYPKQTTLLIYVFDITSINLPIILKSTLARPWNGSYVKSNYYVNHMTHLNRPHLGVRQVSFVFQWECRYSFEPIP